MLPMAMPDPATIPPAPGVIDTHAHLADFADDEAGVLDRAREAGVAALLAVATDAADSPIVVGWAERHPHVWATVGIHPNYAVDAKEGDWEEVAALASHPKVAALGETGLDRYWDKTPFPTQRDYFARHLDLAHALGKAVVIHCRECERDIIDQLAALGRPVRGVLHSFTGTREQARAFLDLGLHISFAGQLTFTNKALDPLRDVAREVPDDRLLVETDSPYLSPHPFRGKRNEPARVAIIARRLADVRGIPVPDLVALTSRNARALFGLG
jgi:TatD DNase family protein